MKMCYNLLACLGMVFLAIGFVFSGTALRAENLTITLDPGEYQIVETDQGEQTIRMDDFGNLLVSGKPMLPAKSFMIALPPGAEVISVTAEGIGPVELDGKYKIQPAPPLLPDADRPEMEKKCWEKWQQNHDITYSTDQIYPENAGRYMGTGELRKYTFARVAYFPFSYHPLSERLIFNPSLTVSIDYQLPSLSDQEVQKLLSDTKADQKASRLFVNYPQAQEWYRPQGMPKSPQQPYNYVIITTDDLADAVSPMVTLKELIGYDVNVVTTSWIQSNYTVGDSQQNIRDFLIDKYIDWGIEYVLLVGNNNDIPMRRCYPDPTNHGTDLNNCPPTDYYYADLTGNWDWDGDGFYGECGQDSVDFFAEVYVGRIPWSDAPTVTSICQKLAIFEVGDHSWKTNALLLGAISNYNNEDNVPGAKTDGASLMESMISGLLSGWSYTTMYETAGLKPSTYPCDLSLTRTNVVGNWGANDYGIVNWWSHGSFMNATRKVWWMDDGDLVPEASEMSFPQFLVYNDTTSLDDDHPSIIFACACQNGNEAADYGLARNLLKRGSAGIIAATRDSWYRVGWDAPYYGGNASLDYYFFHYLISYAEKIGEALFDAKIAYICSEWQDYANLFAFNLYGDPALPLGGLPAHAHIFSISPAQNELNVPVSTNISVTFDNTIDNTTVNNFSFVVNARSTGRHFGTISFDDPPTTVTFNPVVDFDEGEVVTVVLTRGIESLDGVPLDSSFVWSFTVKAGYADAAFDPHVDYAVGAVPHGIFAADFDGDGNLDLATANRSSDDVSVLLNNGDGTFAPHSLYPVGDSPYSIVAADLDGDGDLDLATSNAHSDNVSILLNNGDSTFAPHSTYSIGHYARSIFAADLDGDGDLDLITGNMTDDNVSVLLNNNDGTFAPQSVYPVGDNPRSIFVADLDGDGDLDLATANFNSDDVSVLLNHGDGTFASQSTWPIGDNPTSIFGADFDGDNDIDLVTAINRYDSVSILMNNGDGTFATHVGYPVGDAPLSIFAADLNGDGNLDLAAACGAGGYVSVLLNNGVGAFAAPSVYPIASAPVFVFAADLDGNGYLDLATANINNNISVLFNQRSCNCGAKGDVNNDTSTDPLDVTYLVNYVYLSLDALFDYTATCPYPNGDVNCDSTTDPLDVTYLVNYVYLSLDALCDGCNP